jgi:hypothetical protein
MCYFLVNLGKDYHMNYVLSVLFFLLSCVSVHAQATYQECATVPSQSWASQLRSRVAELQPADDKKMAPLQVPYQIHLFKKSDSTSVLTLADIYSEIDTVNAFYANANMFLYECAPPELIIDDSLYDFKSAEEPILLSQHYTPSVLNLYFPNTAKSGNTLVCGYSRYPPSVDLAIVAAGCAKNGSTLPHEIGHYFGLMHTHETFAGAELVDGSNCSFAGDQICDTPADPTLDYSSVSLSCIYTGTVTDGNGVPYTPDVTNIMSYSRKECRFYFSPLQYAVLNGTMQNERSYLACTFGVGIKELQQVLFSVFPNPGNESLSVTLKQEVEESVFDLYDARGSRMLSVPVSKEYRLDTQSLPAGIYFYTLRISGNSYSGKWVKE